MKIVEILITILLSSLVSRARTESLTLIGLEQVVFAGTETSEKCFQSLRQLNITEEWTLKSE